MPPTKQRASTSTAVSKTAIQQASVTLQELPEKPRASWSLRETVSLLRDPITSALNRGYSYEEVADLLAEQGIEMTVSSLKRYLATARREETPAKPRGRRGRKSQSEPSTNGAEASIEVASEEAEPSEQPTPRKRRTTTTGSRTKMAGKSATAAKTQTKPDAKTTGTRSTRTRKKRGEA